MSHPIENIMHSSMEHIKALSDVNTVIGDPMMTDDNTMILPVSKVSLGMLVGGGEYCGASPCKKSSSENHENGTYPFIGASTLGMSLTPLAFLAVRSDGVRVLPAKQDCPTERLIDLVPKVIDTAERLLRELMGKCEAEEAEGTCCEKNNGKSEQGNCCEHERGSEKENGSCAEY